MYSSTAALIHRKAHTKWHMSQMVFFRSANRSLRAGIVGSWKRWERGHRLKPLSCPLSAKFTTYLLTMPRKKSLWFNKPISVVAVVAVEIAVAWAVPPLQDLRGVVVSPKGVPVANALCTLRGVSLPVEGIGVSTNERGQFDFPSLVPGQYDLICAAVGHVPASENGLAVPLAEQPVLQVVLPELEKLRQTVEVHEAATPLATESVNSAAHLGSQKLNALPLVQEQFQAALPLVPGVVRTPDGKINIKGAGESQGMLQVDNTEMVDPVTGSYSIDLPIDAIESLDVSKAPYNAEFGHFSGGLTSVVTKPPSGRWNYQLNAILPSIRGEAGHISGIAGNNPPWRSLDHVGILRLRLEQANCAGVAVAKRSNHSAGLQLLHQFSVRHFLATSSHPKPTSISQSAGIRRHQFFSTANGFLELRPTRLFAWREGQTRVRLGRTSQRDVSIHAVFQLCPRAGNH